MSSLEDIIDSLENLEVKRALAVKMIIVIYISRYNMTQSLRIEQSTS